MPDIDDINEAQWRVLRWISDGCPDGVFEGYAHRVSASALRFRGLVAVRGRGPTWSAAITPSGSAVLARHQDGPPTAVRKPRARSSIPEPPKAVKRRSPAVAEPASPELVEPPDDPVAATEPPERKISLPDSLRGAVPLVSQTAETLRKAKVDGAGYVSSGSVRSFPVRASPEQSRRAVLALHALTKEAVRRGWTVQQGKTGEPGAAVPAIVAEGHRYYLSIEEMWNLLDFTEAEIGEWRKSRFWKVEERAGKMPPPQLKRREPNGKLRLILSSGTYDRRQRTFNDTNRFGPFTNRLIDIVHEIESWNPARHAARDRFEVR